MAGVGSGRWALCMLLGPRGRTKDSLSSLRILQGHPWGMTKEKGKRGKDQWCVGVTPSFFCFLFSPKSTHVGHLWMES